MFRLRVYSSDGQAYETLFSTVLEINNADFIRVKPQGQFGDRGNDGYDRKLGRYYQVFAPEDPKSKVQDAVTKLKADFDKLYKYWNTVTPVSEYHFVFNDKYKGSFPTIETDLAEIKKSKDLAACSCFLAKHLEQAFLVLEDEHISAVLDGYIPTPEKVETLDYTVLKEVVQFVMESGSGLTADSALSAPKFDDKIKFNGLGTATSALLTAASFQVGVLAKYFDLNSEFAKQTLRDHLATFYAEAKAERADVPAEMDAPDLIFFDILYKIAKKERQAEVNAGLVLMAYFFETCDIYEDPISVK